jgi:putative copper resistance protein D
MTQFLDLFSFLSVLLRGLVLACEALTMGGIIFLLLVSRGLSLGARATGGLLRFLTWSSIGLASAGAAYLLSNSAVLVGSTDMTWRQVVGAGYFVADSSMILGATAIAISARTRLASVGFPFACAAILFGSAMTSHAAGRLEHQFAAIALTLVHQLAAAAWIGGMPYLLLCIRYSENAKAAGRITARFSRFAITSVSLLVFAGAGLSFFYVGSSSAAFGTTYGIMVVSKVLLTCAVLGMGALNLRIVRSARSGASPDLFPLARFAEVEVGIGFTIILAAAALTSAPPAIDLQRQRVTAPEIAERVKPAWPRLETPAWNELSPPTPLAQPDPTGLQSFVPGGQSYTPPLPGDIAWSEYNHHWSGLLVLAMGILALLATRIAWARHWPVLFIALAVFVLIRADPENWPLGPRGFWASFQVAEVSQHRLFVVLIIAFAAFEWAVQTGRLAPARAGLFFPLVCAAGGALLLTHSHSVQNVKEEFLAELSHLPLAILAVIAGWSRWLEIRLPQRRMRAFALVWPVCLVLIGAVLLNYREG